MKVTKRSVLKNESFALTFGQWSSVRELAIFAGSTLKSRMVELARKLAVHVRTILAFRAAIHKVEFAEF